MEEEGEAGGRQGIFSVSGLSSPAKVKIPCLPSASPSSSKAVYGVRWVCMALGVYNFKVICL